MTATVIACGRTDRGDDGAAPTALAAIEPEALTGIRTRIAPDLTVEEVVDAAAVGPIVIADAAVGLPPGVVAIIPFGQLASVSPAVRARSSHELPIADTVALASMLLGRRLEGAIVVVGVSTVAHGAPLSEPVRAAIPRLGLAMVRAARGERMPLPPTVRPIRTTRAEQPATA